MSLSITVSRAQKISTVVDAFAQGSQKNVSRAQKISTVVDQIPARKCVVVSRAQKISTVVDKSGARFLARSFHALKKFLLL